MRAVHRLCQLYPGICLTTEEKARKNLSNFRKDFVRERERERETALACSSIDYRSAHKDHLK
jgi:hypothetical protein